MAESHRGIPGSEIQIAAAGGRGERQRRGESDSTAPSAGRPAEEDRGRSGQVFILDADGRPRPARVRLGISDGQFVELREGLDEGAAVITGTDGGDDRSAAGPRQGGPNNPFAPSFGRRR